MVSDLKCPVCCYGEVFVCLFVCLYVCFHISFNFQSLLLWTLAAGIFSLMAMMGFREEVLILFFMRLVRRTKLYRASKISYWVALQTRCFLCMVEAHDVYFCTCAFEQSKLLH